MHLGSPTPILRIFDEAKAREFYVDFLGFRIDWEHRFEPGLPLYLQVSRQGCRLHLSEHHGDASPGAALRIEAQGLDDLQAELAAKAYKYARPGIVEQPWGREMSVADPFGNRLVFAQRAPEPVPVTIFHNPACGTSRNTLALIRHAGIEPVVVEYLKSPPSKEQLRELLAEMGLSVRELLREKGTPYGELGLGDPQWTDEQLLDFIQQHPILMNRPVVRTALGTRLCRPSEAVLELLPVGALPPFTKEDGEVVRDTGARRS